ncbi:FkbM family methyltransferase [Candidatus Thiosymbion oneisti]|uniref:FkbM family methyltransferase n=1 Tax=Candidatus Thiosymbion oneisti TaxID=589554 RepID=UPI000B7CC62F|nr:FkbM family methyltransferase [Candidatus Thiosymbion oneisti]
MIRNALKSIVERFPRTAQFYRNNRDLLDRNSSAIETPWGFSLAGHPAMASGTFEPEETRLVRGLLQEVDILVNVGTNVGYYCCHALSLGKPVTAVEPIARNLHYLMRNITENGWAQQAEIFPVALGAKADVLKMWGGGTGASLIKGWAGIPESYVTQVPVLTLDRILGSSLQGRQALILVDVEGAEYAVLQGATNSLRHEPRPIWIVEIGSTIHQPSGVTVNPNLVATFEQFFERGYSAVSADAKKAVVNLETVLAAANGEASFETHNFLFR